MSEDSLTQMDTGIPTVIVMMSTYNGEKFIKEQIESILAQKSVDVILVIRDDVSTDSTLAILEEYQKKHQNIKVYPGHKNIGPGESFMQLFYHCCDKYPRAEYFAFADQDDIWLKEKLKFAVEKIKSVPDSNAKPLLYCSNQMIYEEGEKKGLRHKEDPDLTLIGHITRNEIAGCTFVMNKCLTERINNAEHANHDIIKRRIHDAWIMLCALTIGEVIYDSESYILYRIHKNNVVGVKKLTAKEYLERIQKNLFDKSFSNIRSKTAEQLLKSFPEVDGFKRKILEEFAYYQQSWRDKERLLQDEDIMTRCTKQDKFFKEKIFLNMV